MPTKNYSTNDVDFTKYVQQLWNPERQCLAAKSKRALSAQNTLSALGHLMIETEGIAEEIAGLSRRGCRDGQKERVASHSQLNIKGVRIDWRKAVYESPSPETLSCVLHVNRVLRYSSWLSLNQNPDSEE